MRTPDTLLSISQIVILILSAASQDVATLFYDIADFSADFRLERSLTLLLSLIKYIDKHTIKSLFFDVSPICFVYSSFCSVSA
jgi:hypothetical protein